MKKMFALVAILALSGCMARTDIQEQEADIANVQANLPAGCTLQYAGSVRIEGRLEKYPSRVFVTVCEDTVTTSETHVVQQGKTAVNQNDINVVTR